MGNEAVMVDYGGFADFPQHEILMEGQNPEVTTGQENEEPQLCQHYQCFPCEASLCDHISYSVEEAKKHRKDHSLAEILMLNKV